MRERGFALIDLMFVVVIIGILAAIATPNFMSMRCRAKEASLRSNMHTLQLAAEDFSTMAEGAYPQDCATTVSEALVDLGFGAVSSATKSIAGAASGPPMGGSPLLPSGFKNPFLPTDDGWQSVNPGTTSGCTYFRGLPESGTEARQAYSIRGYGKDALLVLILTAAQ